MENPTYLGDAVYYNQTKENQTTMKNQLDQYSLALTLLSNFNAKHHAFLESVSCICTLDCIPPKVYLHNATADAGDYFGKDGWTRKAGYPATSFNWLRTIDDVIVQLTGAEQVSVPADGDPVPPKSFPLLLN